ncbi:MAG: HIT domain-containing protein [Myxococcales bacterium]|nr:HIT domain-containing protein [Myxococcales bacterium]
MFCQFLAGEAEASFNARGDHAVAIMDIGQINPGRVLVMPRRHAVQLDDLTEDEAANVFRLVHRLAQALPKSGLRCEGYRVSQVNGAAAGQEVFHVHFHLVPRFRGEAVRICILVDEERPRDSR